MTINILGVDNVLFAVADLDAAVDFYADRLGLPLAFRLDDPGLALFRLGPETPGLLVRIGSPSSGRVWLEVRDARATADALRTRGVEPQAEPFAVATGWTVEVADPWGNVVGFTDYTTTPTRARP